MGYVRGYRRYSRTTYRKRPAARLAGAKTQKTNTAVKRVYKRRPKPTKANLNKQAVFKLAKQVKDLQKLRYGEIQRNELYLTLLYGPQQAAPTPAPGAPVAFLVNDFYPNQLCFRGSNTGGVAGYGSNGAFLIPGYQEDMNDEHEFTPRMQDIVSNTIYKPVYTSIRMTIKVNGQHIHYPGTVRITILKVKPYDHSNKVAVGIPGNLGAYRNLALNLGEPAKNEFNPKFHTVLYNKYLKIDTKARYAGDQDIREYNLSVPVFYGNMVLKPDLVQMPVGQEMWTNTPVSKHIWCLISVNHAAAEVITSIHIRRLNSWRDPHGVLG